MSAWKAVRCSTLHVDERPGHERLAGWRAREGERIGIFRVVPQKKLVEILAQASVNDEVGVAGRG